MEAWLSWWFDKSTRNGQDQQFANYSLWAKPNLLCVSENGAYWNTTTTDYFMYFLSLLSCYYCRVVLLHNGNCVAHKSKILTIWLFRKKFADPGQDP